MKAYLIALASLPLLLAACSESDNGAEKGKESALKEQAKVWTEETKKLGEIALQSAKESAAETYVSVKDKAEEFKVEYWSKETGKVCQFVDAAKEEAIAASATITGLIGGTSAATTAAGVTAVSHSSGAVILTGSGGYIAGTLGTAGATLVSVLTAPATIAAAAVSVVAVGGAIYVCKPEPS